MDFIELKNVELDCIIGILDREQRAPQRVQFEVALGLDVLGAEGGDLSASVDYAAVLDQLRFVAQQGRFRLLESLVPGLCRLFLARPAPNEGRAQVERVMISAHKPQILAPHGVPGVRYDRTREDLLVPTRILSGGIEQEVMVECAETGVYRLQLVPGGQFAIPADVALYVVVGPVIIDGVARGRGETVARGGGQVVEGGGTVVAVGRPFGA